MKIVYFMIGFALCMASCGDPLPEQEQIKTYDTSTLYYDIPLAVDLEIATLSHIHTAFERTIDSAGMKTTGKIDSNELRQTAAPFMEYNLNESRFRKYYKESIFEDNDTRSIVLNYSTNHPELPVKNASVMLDNQTQGLKRIDILRSFATKDSTIEERLSWTVERGFQIVRLTATGNQETTMQLLVNWKER